MRLAFLGTSAFAVPALGALVEAALANGLPEWRASARGRLALVILLDQFADVDTVRAVVEHDTEALDPVDAAVVELADKVTEDPASVTQADVERLRSLGPSDADILDVVHGASLAANNQAPSPQTEELSPSELRVLRYLPTNLSRPEIASQLSVSVNTVNTHIRSIYAKLQTSSRSSAVQRARDLRLLSAGRAP